ncbi:MAG TPA: LysR family transcriptional regulator [Casimicrobiaceae bacterium]|jgi:LysR family transcriptional regulator for bpeEF and oprC
MDKLRAMQYFVRVAETKSLTSAARAFEISPSAVSRVISSLEHLVGFELFHRSTRRLSLTADGEAYLERCRRIFQDLDDAESEGKRQRGTPRGTLKIGLHPAFRIAFFGEVVQLLRRYPELKLETRITNSPSILLDEGFDVLIRVGELPDSNLVARPLGWLSVVVAAAPAYLEKHGEPKTPRDLERHRVILPARLDDGSSARWDFQKNDTQCTVGVQGFVMVRDGMGLPELAVSGAGIAHLCKIALAHAIADGRLKPILTDWSCPRHPVYAVFPTARSITPKTVALMEFVSDLIARVEGRNRGSSSSLTGQEKTTARHSRSPRT